MAPTHTIRLAGSDTAVDCPADRTILDACLDAGLPMPYNCRSGECAEVQWTFLGLSIPGWTLLIFILMTAFGALIAFTRARRAEGHARASGTGARSPGPA